MKIFKKAIALITAAVMALSVNAFALEIEFSETIDTVPAWAAAHNDTYMCMIYTPEKYLDCEDSVVHVYKNVDNNWKHWATLSPNLQDVGGDNIPFRIKNMAMGANNTLYLNLWPQKRPEIGANGEQGCSVISAIYLDQLNEGEEHVERMNKVTFWQDWGPGLFPKSYPYGDGYLFAQKDSGPVYAYKDDEFIHEFAEGSMSPWDPTVDRNYAIKNKSSSTSILELYDANKIEADSDNKLVFPDLKYKLRVPGNVDAVIVSGNYAVVIQGGGAYKYDLTNALPSNVIEPVDMGSIGGTYGEMDIYGTYCAVYSRSGMWLTIFDLETGKVAKQWNKVMSATGNYAFLEFNSIGVSIAHAETDMDVYKMKTGVIMGINSGNWKYADLIDGELVESQDGSEYVKMDVSITNATLEDIEDGNVILAAYEGDLLTGVSVKPLSVAAGDEGTVWTEFVPYATILKVFYWTSDCEPIVAEPYVDIWGG